MPVQQQNSSFAKRLGSRVAEANAEHADKPIDTGNRRLPAGIRNGIARLSAMYTKEQTEDRGLTPKGETFFRASAIVVSPEHHNGEKVSGQVTQVVIPLCDIPAKGQRKAKPFGEQWFEFQNLFKLLSNGTIVCNPDPVLMKSDPTKESSRVQAYYFEAMKALTDPVRAKTNPVYISFSTRGWTPPPSPQQPRPEEMVFETWHGLAQWNGAVDPSAGMTQAPPQPPISEAQPPEPPPQYQPPQEGEDKEELVATLVEVASSDPESEDGREAAIQLEELAWAQGWTKEQTGGAEDWEAVGAMALNSPSVNENESTNNVPAIGVPAIGGAFRFTKRGRDGNKLTGKDGRALPARDVVVESVNTEDGTCTLKSAKDGKPIVDLKKNPIHAKFEWLE